VAAKETTSASAEVPTPAARTRFAAEGPDPLTPA
jgi:hypothetical protein